MTGTTRHSFGTTSRRLLVRHATTAVNRSHVTTTRSLLTEGWASDVGLLETTVRRLDEEGLVGHNCQVAFFEVVHDPHLHVNVTLQFPRRTVPGWAGRAQTPGGFVYNRRFAGTVRSRIARTIRDMVLARSI